MTDIGMKPDTDNTRIALIENNLSYLVKGIDELKVGMKELSGVYATQIAVTELATDLDIRLVRLEKSSNMWKWLSPTLSSAVTALIVFLLIFFLNNVK